jgi:hypothetical protein
MMPAGAASATVTTKEQAMSGLHNKLVHLNGRFEPDKLKAVAAARHGEATKEMLLMLAH